MTREAIKRLLVVIGVALLVTMGVVLPLHAASSLQPFALQPISPISPPTSPTPETPTPTTAPEPTNTPSPTVMPPTSIPPSPTPPTPLTTPPAPSPTPTPTVGWYWFLIENKVWFGGGCLLLLLLILIVILILAAGRRARRQPEPSLPPSPVVSPYLETAGDPAPRRFYLNPEGSTIGRAEENNLVITQDFVGWETVSRRHARIYEQAGRWIVEDTGSMNGVYVNKSRTGHNLLRDGWQLGIGGVEFIFHAGTGEARQ